MGAGVRLKEILRDRGLTIKQLSEMADVSINTLYSITKRDSENIDPVIFKRITTILGISFDEFWGISPLPPRKVPLFDDDPDSLVAMDTSWQEYSAFNEYLKDMGYRTVIEMGPDNPDCLWSLYDDRSGKKYYVPAEMLQKLMDSINSFAKFQIASLITEINKAKVPAATNDQD